MVLANSEFNVKTQMCVMSLSQLEVALSIFEQSMSQFL